MNSKEFVARLVEEMDRLFARLGETETLESESEGQVDVVHPAPPRPEERARGQRARRLLDAHHPRGGRQDGPRPPVRRRDEALRLISQRLAELGEDLVRLRSARRRPQPALPVPARPAHHGRAHRRRPLRQRGDRQGRATPSSSTSAARWATSETARLYADTIQPEEAHHHHLGREILEKYCTTPELQELAAAAVRNTLAIADELRNLAAKTTGVHNIPVS